MALLSSEWIWFLQGYDSTEMTPWNSSGTVSEKLFTSWKSEFFVVVQGEMDLNCIQKIILFTEYSIFCCPYGGRGVLHEDPP